MLAGGPIAWCSKRQAVVALSTTEAEYIALSQAAREAAWLRQLMNDLGIWTQKEIVPIPINCDNNGAIALAKNSEFHKRVRHIDIIYHYVRQEIEKGYITTPYIPSDQNLADGFTKPLNSDKHQEFVRSLGLDRASVS